MNVQAAMTKAPVSCSADTNLATATELMWKNDCGILPVVDANAKVIGIATDRDMLIAVGTRNRRPSDLSMGEVMNNRVITCKPEDEIESVLATMNGNRIRRLPVVDDAGTLIGILAINDIVLRSAESGNGETVVGYEDLVSALKGICDHTHMALQRAAAA